MLTVSIVVFMLVVFTLVAVGAIVVAANPFSTNPKNNSRSVAWETEVIEELRPRVEFKKIEEVFCVDDLHVYSERCECHYCRIIYWFEANQHIRVLEQRSLIVDSII